MHIFSVIFTLCPKNWVGTRNDGAYNEHTNEWKCTVIAIRQLAEKQTAALKPDKQQKQQPNNYPVVSEIFESVVFDQFDKDFYRCPGSKECNH